jgi:hypothetical protein
MRHNRRVSTHQRHCAVDADKEKQTQRSGYMNSIEKENSRRERVCCDAIGKARNGIAAGRTVGSVASGAGSDGVPHWLAGLLGAVRYGVSFRFPNGGTRQRRQQLLIA